MVVCRPVSATFCADDNMMDTPSWPSILTRLNEIDDVWNLFDAANATNAVRATVRTGGPYARLVMRGASYALFTVGGCDVVCEASLQYQNADASSFLLMILRQRFDEYFIDEYMHSTIAHLNS